MKAPSTNIAQFWNLGTERYECLKTNRIDAFIDIQIKNQTYIASLQWGKSMKCVITDTFASKGKKAAIKKAFDQIVKYIGNDKILMAELRCPDILRPYKIKDNNIDNKSKLEMHQLSLF